MTNDRTNRKIQVQQARERTHPEAHRGSHRQRAGGLAEHASQQEPIHQRTDKTRPGAVQHTSSLQGHRQDRGRNPHRDARDMGGKATTPSRRGSQAPTKTKDRKIAEGESITGFSHTFCHRTPNPAPDDLPRPPSVGRSRYRCR